MVEWLSVFGEVQTCCGQADATASHCLLLQEVQIGFAFLLPAYLGSARQRVIKWVLLMFRLQVKKVSNKCVNNEGLYE